MSESDLRQVVAWRGPVQWATCLALWLVFGIAVAIPELEWPLRVIAPFGFGVALLRSAVLLIQHDRSVAPAWLRGLSVCADVMLLTELLDITGGPFNPFVVIYAVDVWVAAITVSTTAAAMVGLVATVSFGWLVVDHLRAGLAEHHRLNDFPTHLFTMAFTGSAVAELVAEYVARARIELAHRQAELEAARDRAARSERLASLTTLAAGAAHELSTPLSTIAVVASELERIARTDGAGAADLRGEVALIQEAVQRCRSILDGMSGRATGDVIHRRPMTPAAIAERACAALPPERRRRLTVTIDVPDHAIEAGADLSRALSSLLKNAFDASEEAVSLRSYVHDAVLRFEVTDRGQGMTDETRRRAGEPFYTTKPPGQGLGLGLFLARAVTDQLGGSLRFESQDGTTAILEIPVPAAGAVR
jgi:two-component system sensor histidine kinase RegB